MKRSYVSPARGAAAAETRERIIAAGARLLRKDASILVAPGLLRHLPNAALAAVVIASAIGLELHGFSLRWSNTRFALPSERASVPGSTIATSALSP